MLVALTAAGAAVAAHRWVELQQTASPLPEPLEAVRAVFDGPQPIGLTCTESVSGGAGTALWLDPAVRGRGRGDDLAMQLSAAGRSAWVPGGCDLELWLQERGFEHAKKLPGGGDLFDPPTARNGRRLAASVCLLDPVRRRVLIGKRLTPPWLGYWAFPGGKQEGDEDLLHTALRELEERRASPSTTPSPWPSGRWWWARTRASSCTTSWSPASPSPPPCTPPSWRLAGWTSRGGQPAPHGRGHPPGTPRAVGRSGTRRPLTSEVRACFCIRVKTVERSYEGSEMRRSPSTSGPHWLFPTAPDEGTVWLIWLVRLRWLALFAQTVTLAFVFQMLDGGVAIGTWVAAMGVLAGANAWATGRPSQRGEASSDWAPSHTESLLDDLRNGRCHFVIDITGESAETPDIRAAKLFDDELETLARLGHPLLEQRPDADGFGAAEHIAVHGLPSFHSLGGRLAQSGRAIQQVSLVSSALVGVMTTLGSNALLTLPGSLARHLERQFDLARIPQPMDPVTFPVRLLWHTSYDRDECHQWLREEFASLAQGSTA